MRNSTYGKTKQFWCRLFLGVITFILPFINVQAWAVEENIVKLNNLSPTVEKHPLRSYNIEQNLAVWVGTDPTNGLPALFVNDYNGNEVKLSNGPVDQFSYPKVSEDYIVYAKRIDNKYNLYLCQYNADSQLCDETTLAEDVGFLYGIAIEGNKIAWSSAKSGVGNTLNYCVFNGATCPANLLMTDRIESEIDMSGDHIVFNLENPAPIGPRDVFLYHLGKNKLIQISNTSSIQDLNVRVHGNLIVWENSNTDPVTHEFKSNQAWVHYCYFDNATETCPEKILNTGFNKSSNPDVYGDIISFTGGNYTGSTTNYDVYLYDVKSNAKIQVTSDVSLQTYSQFHLGRLVWADARNNPPFPDSLYYADVAQLIANATPPPPANNNAPQIITYPQIQKLMWDHGFYIKFNIAASDADGNMLEFSHPLANEVPKGAREFFVYQSGPGSVAGEFYWKPSVDVVAGLNLNQDDFGPGINWNVFNNMSSSGINWSDVNVFTTFAVTDQQFTSAAKTFPVQPVYVAANNNGFCDNGLKGYIKTEVENSFADSGINWDDSMAWKYKIKFKDLKENMAQHPNDCTQAVCGNYAIEDGEQCDEYLGLTFHQKCSKTCQIINLTHCGDGIVQTPNEEGKWEYCDGTSGVGAHQKCDAFCKLINLTYCGDGIKQTPNGEGVSEQCDGTSGVGAHQSCSASCQLINIPYCGDGIQQANEECDEANTSNNDDCLTTCVYNRCGDGYVHNESFGPETCDDGNNVSGDGCSSSCLIETPPQVCGNGVKEGTEQCDGTAGVGAHQTCNSYCQLVNLTYCGDGTKQNPNHDGIYEACDDGNTVNGDGCSSTCQSEIIYGTNLVSNGDFSSGKSNWTGWNSNIVLDPAGVNTLPYAVKFTLSNNRVQNLAASLVDVQPNKNHIISFKGISTMESGNAVLRVQWKKSNGTNVGQDSYVYFDVRKKNMWDIAQINVQSPDLAVKAKVSIDVSAVSGTFVLDDVSIQGQQN